MDLTRAEAVMDLISARGEASARAAAAQLEGRLGRVVEKLREDALSALAQNRRIGAAIALGSGAEGHIHDWASICSRAARSFSRNCAALMT
jgi:hypothetical protein